PSDLYALALHDALPISVKSFSHVSYIGSVANVFVVHPSVPAKNMNELVAWIRAEKNPVAYGSGGIGSIGHLVGETMKKDLGLKIDRKSTRLNSSHQIIS